MLTLDVKIELDDEQKFKQSATQIALQIRPDWRQEDVRCKIFTDGITNKLIGLYSNKSTSKYDDMILVRGYGHNSELMIDRNAEVRNMQFMCDNGLGAKLYARFKNGLAYEFLKGDTLTMQDAKDPKFFPMVAKTMKNMHDVPNFNREPSMDKACIWDLLWKFHKISPDGFPNMPEKNQRYKAEVFSKAQLGEEIKKMEQALKEDGDKQGVIVFAHNDVLLGNVVKLGNGNMSFIDFEYGDLNYREYDIANHFCEMVGMGDENGRLDYQLYPDVDFQLKWIEAYLGNSATEHEVKVLQSLVDRFSPLPHLMWGIWALIQQKNSSIDFDFLDYGIQRLNQYKATANQAFRS